MVMHLRSTCLSLSSIAAIFLSLSFDRIGAALLSSVNEHLDLSDEGGQLLAHTELAQKTKSPRDVVICRGLGDMNEEQFKALSAVWKRYASQKVITATSPLLYRITDDGTFRPFHDGREIGLDFEKMSKKYLSPTGTKSLPHVWCDASCCQNCKLPDALVEAMKRKQEFFSESVQAAIQFGWHGYSLDFEGNTGDTTELTQFFNEWAAELGKHQGPNGHPLELHLWTGSGVSEQSLSNVMTSVIDMSNYYNQWFADDHSLVSWRQLRAQSLLQTNGKSSICPFGDKHQQKPSANQSFLQRQELLKTDTVDASTRVADINNEINSFCSQYQGKCAFGLITYDLPGARLQCSDMVQLGHKAARSNVQSLWIWSGGLMSSHWEVGLRSFVEGFEGADGSSLEREDSERMCNKHLASLRQLSDAESWWGPGHMCSDCDFDGEYCCDGSPRKKSGSVW